MSKIISTTLIDEVAETILNARDFCGNEQEAALDHLADYNLTGDVAMGAYRMARFRANNLWNQSQREAGVPEKHLF